MENSKRLTLAFNLFFVAEGTEVDGITVDKNTYPDTEPATNWPDFGCTDKFKTTKDTVEGSTFRCVLPDGRVVDMTEPMVVGSTSAFETENWNRIATQLYLGLENPVTAETIGVAVTPNAKKYPGIVGWLKTQATDLRAGTNFYSRNDYGRLTLVNGEEFTNGDDKFPKWEFEALFSPEDTVLLGPSA